MKHGTILISILLIAASLTALPAPLCAADVRDLRASSKEYPNADLLVSADSLQAGLGAANLVVIDARPGKAYHDGHVPGAVNIIHGDFSTKGRGLKPVADLEALLGAAGLGREATYVIYDDTSASSGAAGRVFWMLEYLGCRDVRMLDGGWDKWKADDRPTEKKAAALPATVFKASPNGRVRSTKDAIKSRMTAADFVLIDARTDEEYTGWTLRGEARGGHIPNAVQVPYAWFFDADKTVLPYGKLKSLFESRGITRDKEVTAYCAGGNRSAFVYFALRLMGYPRVSNYDASMAEWASDASLPMDRLARYEKLVYPAWLKDLLDGKNPPTYAGKKYVVLEVRYSGFSTAQKADVASTGYIPGAVAMHICYLDRGTDETNYYPNWTHPDQAYLLPPDKLRQALLDLGITRDTVVIVYGNGKIIPMIAARAAWALMYAGVEDVRVLNGGFTAWAAAGYPVSAVPAAPRPAADFGASVPVHPEYLAKLDYARLVSSGTKKTAVMVDVRKHAEYEGTLNPYPFFTKKGSIPNAVWQDDWDTLVDLRDDTYRSYTEVAKKWTSLGITPDKEPVFYCGGGWRSSIGFLHAYLMGFKHARNYNGGFYEWSWYPDNRIDKGR